MRTLLLPSVVGLLLGVSPLRLPAPAQETQSLSRRLPVDPKITVGRFDNGLRYYIRENRKPENRAELRLVVNAGSVLEEDDQQGLAHFVEHMAFNGTEHFAKQEIVDYLESIGMQFGPDINAYTNFDETVYMLQVPTDSAEILATAFQILEDWAHGVTFEAEEVEKERGVVIEEWRLGRGAAARLRDQQFPILFRNSRYAERLPIGRKAILESAPREALLRLYRDWYRPNLMAVVAVGDFDGKRIEGLIQRHFAHLNNPERERERVLYPVPDHKETRFAIACDPEATGTNVSVYHKMDPLPERNEGDYRRLLVEGLYNSLLNNRLQELLQSPDPPFLFGFSSKGSLVRAKDAYILGAAVKDNGVETGLEALLTEAKRVRLYGFTQSELEREKSEMLRSIEQAYKERDKTESGTYAAEYIRNFLTDEPIPGIEYEFMLYNKYVPGIQLDEVNALAGAWLREENRVILVSAPEKPDVTLPTEANLLAVFDRVDNKTIAPYADTVPDQPLVSTPPAPGRIVAQDSLPELGLTEWTLSNGVKVVLKPTDFKNDEVLMMAFSPGGHSLVSDALYVPASSAASLVREGGVGGFDQIALQKKLAGKLVSVSPWIGELQEGISGNASPQDLETLFQLTYLYFTAPRRDSTAFLSFQSRVKAFIANRHASPEAAFEDTIQVTMSSYHPRSRPWSEAMLDEMDLETSLRIYRDRFADASDFTFIFVGNFDPDSLRPLVETYLGGLPALHRQESWRDVGMRPPEGVVEKTVRRGLEDKSQVRLIFTGPFEWTRKSRHVLSSLAEVLEIRLRQVLRENLGGTYGVGVWTSISHYPRDEYSLTISFGCAPARVEELTATVFQQIDSLRTHGTSEAYLVKVKEQQRRNRETSLKRNGFWLNTLRSYYFYREDPRSLLTFGELVEGLTLTDIQTAARRYLRRERYAKFILYPATSGNGGGSPEQGR